MSASRGTVSRDCSERLVSDLHYDLPSGSEDEGEAESDSDSIQPQDILEETNEASSSSECEDDPGTSTVITTNRAQSEKEQLQALSTKDLVWESKPFSQQGHLPFTGSESVPDDVKNLNMGAKAEKRRGRPIADCDIPAKRAPRQTRPPTDVGTDNHEHWPCVSHDRQGCKNEGCQRKSSVYCVKCEVFLCLRQSQNCFREFHRKFLA